MAVRDDIPAGIPLLLARLGARTVALPVEHVIETMRPLPVAAFPDMPRYVQGVARIRGEPVPVLDLGAALGQADAAPRRFVTVRCGARVVALAVSDVVGIETVPARSLRELPPLVGRDASDRFAAIAALDADLLVVLRAARLYPAEAP